jgi:hypothetical protein
MVMSMKFGKLLIQMICVACYIFVQKLLNLQVFVISIDLVHPLSIIVCGHVSNENLPADR